MSDRLPYSRLRTLPRVSLKDAVPLPGPLTMFVEPTNICNFKCVYCPESFSDFEERSGGLHRMDLATFKRIADQIAEIGPIKTLNFYMMGEPLVNKSLPRFIRIAKEKNATERVCVTTNATLLKENIAREIIEADLDYLRVSIYGGNADAHRRKTQSKISLDRIVQNVAFFRKMRDDLDGRTVIYVKMIDSGSADENAQFMTLFSEIGDEVTLEPVMNWNDPEEGDLSQMDRKARLSLDYYKLKKQVCPFPFYTLVVHADLRVSVCCVDWAKEAVVGDLRQETLAQIWRGEKLKAFQLMHLQRRAHEHKACRDCTYLHTAPDNVDDLTETEFTSRSFPNGEKGAFVEKQERDSLSQVETAVSGCR
jgi:radical SAM protein with 4Fe4S-binding SPASM domain